MDNTDEARRMIEAAVLLENAVPFDNLAVSRLLRLGAEWQASRVDLAECPQAIHGKFERTPNGLCPWCQWEDVEQASRKVEVSTDEQEEIHMIVATCNFQRHGDTGSNTYEVAELILAAGYGKVEVTRLDDVVRVFYYDHSCEWLTKYCDENHKRSALVPRAALGGGGGDHAAR